MGPLPLDPGMAALTTPGWTDSSRLSQNHLSDERQWFKATGLLPSKGEKRRKELAESSFGLVADSAVYDGRTFCQHKTIPLETLGFRSWMGQCSEGRRRSDQDNASQAQ